MYLLEFKYIRLLSNRLLNYKIKSPTLINFTCPLPNCNDNLHKKNRARGYVYIKKDKIIYYCHNCGASMMASQFIKLLDESLYKEFVLEKLQDKRIDDVHQYQIKIPKYIKSDILKGLKKVSQLSNNHPVKKFVVDRQIPNIYHAKLFSCPNFMEYINGIIPNKYSEESLKHDEIRLLIPFIDKNENIHALQGRSIKKSNVKYMTIIIDESIPKIYGLDTVNFNKNVYVFEGPIDSMFINNSISTAGGDIISALNGYNKENLIIIYDNESRSRETIKKIDKAIMNGYKVCIWPDNIQHKDINDMVLNGYKTYDIEKIINENIYYDLSAKLKLSNWRKI